MIRSRGLQPLNERMPTAIRKARDFDARIPWPGHRLELRAFVALAYSVPLFTLMNLTQSVSQAIRSAGNASHFDVGFDNGMMIGRSV